MAAETITVLFTDLVGSTELLSRVGEARADELRREHFGLLRAVLTNHGGREVKNLGDGLMVAFDGVTPALDAAVVMQQEITLRAADAEPLAIRIGISVGEAESEDGDYFGLPVVEAARLCSKADGGEILTTEFVRMLARSRSTAELEPVGALELKGLDQPVETYRVRWAPAVVSAVERPPLPLRLVSSLSPTFVGRTDERERLATAWNAVVAGQRSVLLLGGEPGIGKTTLAAQFACDAYDSGAVVAYGRSDEDLGVPYQPFIESLGQLVAHAPENVLAAHVADVGAHLGRLVPELARRVPLELPSSGDGDAERFVLYGCVTDLLARISEQAPLLVVLDDLHWADRASVQLLRHLATADRPMRVGVLGTFRDSEITTDHPMTELLAALHREGCSERIALRGLNDDDLLDLLEGIAGHGMDNDGVALRDAIFAETAGNPFFVGEILRHLAETGAIYERDDGRWVADTDLRAVGLPVSVREVIGHRVAALGSDTERVLGLGAVIGRDFDVPLLAAVADLEEDTLIDLCDAAAAAAVLQTTDQIDRYSFAHALIEHALYDALSPSRRSRAHRAVAEQLERMSASDSRRAGQLAYHWAEAGQPADAPKAIHYATVAAASAAELYAPDEAARWYAQALELLDRGDGTDPSQRAEILVGLGKAQRQCGIPSYRETLLEAAWLADSSDAVALLVTAAIANNRGWQSAIGEVDHERISVIDRALQRLDDVPSPDRARLLVLAANEKYYEGELDGPVRLAHEAVAVTRRSGDQVALASVLAMGAWAIRSPSTLAQRVAWLNEACELADQFDDPEASLNSHDCLRQATLEQGDLDGIRTHTAAVRDAAGHIPEASLAWTESFHEVWPALLRGDLAEAEHLAEAALALGTESGQPDAFTIFGAQFLNIRQHQGRLHETVALIEDAVTESPALAVYRAVLAQAIAQSDDRARAAEMLAQARNADFELPSDNAWTTGMAGWADAAARLKDTASAEILRDRLAPFHDQIVTTNITCGPPVAHYLGALDHLLGRYDDAEHWFSEATTIAQRMESPLLIAYANAAWAALLADRDHGDDTDRAHVMAESALTAATAGGYGYIERDARAVLDRLA